MERKRRGIVNKECKECGFQGKLNEEGICKSCERVEDQEGRKEGRRCVNNARRSVMKMMVFTVIIVGTGVMLSVKI